MGLYIGRVVAWMLTCVGLFMLWFALYFGFGVVAYLLDDCL